MISRRSLIAGLAAGTVRVARPAATSFLDFVHVTDTHVINPGGVDPRLVKMRSIFAHTRKALPADLAAFRRNWKAEFAFVTGDLIDVYSFLGEKEEVVTGQVETFAGIMAESPLPLYTGLGNHDVQHYGLLDNGLLAPDQSNLEQAKAAWIRKVPCFEQGTYYAFHRDVGKNEAVAVHHAEQWLLRPFARPRAPRAGIRPGPRAGGLAVRPVPTLS